MNSINSDRSNSVTFTPLLLFVRSRCVDRDACERGKPKTGILRASFSLGFAKQQEEKIQHIALYRAALYRTASHCIRTALCIPYRTVPYHTTPYHIALCHIVQHHTAPYGAIFHHTKLPPNRTVPYRAMLCHTLPPAPVWPISCRGRLC